MKLLLGFFSIFLFFSSHALSKDLVDKVAATVNDEVVLLSELQSLPSRLSKPGGVDELLLLGQSMESFKKDRASQLNFLIREKLVQSEIKRLGYSISDERVEAEVAALARKNNATPAEFSAYLASQGYTLEEFKRLQKTKVERQQFFEREIVTKLRISDEDAYSVYKSKNPDSRQTLSEFTIAQIFFSLKKGGADSARARADKAFSRLSSGELFESLANQLDETPGSNKNGVLGSFKSGEFIPQLESAIAGLTVGATSEVLRGPNGFHIIKLLDRKSVLDPNFIRVKEAIKASLVQQNFERQLKNWFEIKKLQATIKIHANVL